MYLLDLVWESLQRPLASKQGHERTRKGNGGKNLLASPCGLHSGDLGVFRLLIRYFSAMEESFQLRRPNRHHCLWHKCGSHSLCSQSYCRTQNFICWCLCLVVFFQIIILLDSRWKTLILTVDSKTINAFMNILQTLLSCPSIKLEPLLSRDQKFQNYFF